jgi:hypothetical protein
MKRIFQILFFATFIMSGLALAQQPAKDGEGFEPVNGDMLQPGESIPASRLVALAYGFIFVSVMVWVGSVARRSRRVEEEMEALKKKLESRV